MILIYTGGFAIALLLFIKKKINKRSAGLIMTGSLIALCLHAGNILGWQGDAVWEIPRSEKSGREKTLELEAEAEGEKETIRVRISPQEYTEEELYLLSRELWEKLEDTLPGENESLDRVTENLCFPEYAENYPFTLKWSTDDPSLLSGEGRIGEDIPPEGAIVEVRLQMTVDNRFEAEQSFFVRVFPSGQAQAFWRRLEKKLTGLERETRLSGQYVLPESFEGKALVFHKKRGEKSGLIFFLSLGAAIAIMAGQKREEEQQKKHRLQEMERDYTQVISRMAMLIGAGMTVSGAFKGMIGDYGRRKPEQERPLYEELLVTSREMDSGISEGRAYQNLGKRCGLPCLVRFTSLLLQYNRSGGAGLKNALKEETGQALQERRDRARRLGEEAGTKLLLPMTMMLVLVMAVIMIPAFTSFGI